MAFDKFSEIAIENHGKKLEGKCLKDLGIENKSKKNDKGGFNKIVESEYFKIDNNNLQIADFWEAGIELKITPLRRIKPIKASEFIRQQKGFSVKERTVLTMIDYHKLATETWENNSLSKKAFKILFGFYIWEKDVSNLEYVFDLVSLWEPSKQDLEIIRNDWEFIVKKVKDGRAHEISEGDTLYLGACTKGETAKSTRKQPFSEIQAKQRAFSFKRFYMDSVYEELLQKQKRNTTSIKKENKTLEESLKELFENYLGKTAYDIEKSFDLNFENYNKLPKSYYADLSNKILGTDSVENIEEFNKAGIFLKTIRVKKDGTPVESIPLPIFKFKELIEESIWEESQLYSVLTSQKFLFVIYEIQKDKKIEFDKLSDLDKRKFLKLKKVKLWNISESGLEEMEKVWEETKKVINNGVKIVTKNGKDFNDFPGLKFNGVGHVRPHAKDKQDTYPLPDGNKMTKQCFWLNANYIKNELK